MSTKKPTSAETRPRQVLPSWALTVLVAVGVYWTLRNQVLDAYPVPTPSMEPTIEGDERAGDFVLVDKTFDNRSRPGRFDTIVFAHQRRIVVKRVVALPGEYVLIRDHDLWVGPSVDELALVAKSPVEHADLLAAYWDSARSESGFASPRWRRERTRPAGAAGPHLVLEGADLGPGDLFPPDRFHGHPLRRASRWREAWNLSWNGVVTTGYLDGFSRLQEGRTAFDFGVRARVRAGDEADLWIELRYGRASFAARYRGDGDVSLWRNGEPYPDSAATGKAPPRPLERAVDLTFVHLDGAFWLALDGTETLRVAVSFDEIKAAVRQVGPRGDANGIAIAAAGGDVVLEHLAVVHDFHYLELGSHAIFEPYRVPDGEYFLLGDNSQDSRDSRHYGSIPERHFIGRPVAVAAPWSRRRLIRR